MNHQRSRELILETLIDRVTWSEACERIMRWARAREHRSVCICNVHSVVTAVDSPELRAAINSADLATPDGKPVAWLIGRRTRNHQERINGPDLTLKLCALAEQEGIAVAFFGSNEDTLGKLIAALGRKFPRLTVAAAISPPFRVLSADERTAYVRQLDESGAGIVFVGLGCPKQEIWMAENTAQIRGVVIGVGAAFDFFAGTARRPPSWMQHAGLEWLGRLLAEPRRLWRRYLYTNTIYVSYVIKEIILGREAGSPRGRA